jgi:hypothetical protein
MVDYWEMSCFYGQGINFRLARVFTLRRVKRSVILF